MSLLPQVEDGFTRLANTLIDALSRHRIAGEQMQCLMVIIRQTYGFQRKSAAISLTAFQRATGLESKSVRRALDKLKQARIIKTTGGNNATGNIATGNKAPTQTKKYEIQKDFRQWLTAKEQLETSSNGGKGNITPSDEGTITPTGGGAILPVLKRNKDYKDYKESEQPTPSPVIDLEVEAAKAKAKATKQLHQEILDAYLQVAAPEWPIVTKLTQQHRSSLNARIRDDAERNSIHWWHWYFQYCKSMPFLRGEGENNHGFRASFVWLIGPKNMDKCLSGAYNTEEEARVKAGREREKVLQGKQAPVLNLPNPDEYVDEAKAAENLAKLKQIINSRSV